jgi:hypothetical protein
LGEVSRGVARALDIFSDRFLTRGTLDHQRTRVEFARGNDDVFLDAFFARAEMQKLRLVLGRQRTEFKLRAFQRVC